MQEDVLQDDLWSHGTEANTTSSLDPIRDAVSARKALPWPFRQRGGIALCTALSAAWLGAAQQCLQSAVVKDIVWAAAADCFHTLIPNTF